MSKTTQTARLVQVTYIDDGMGRRLVLSRTGQAVAETMPVATNHGAGRYAAPAEGGTTAMSKDHPLLMQGPLVRATLEGRKTQTRRLLRNQPPSGYHLVRVCGPWAEFENDALALAKYSTKSPLGETGDRIWVRETWDWRDWQSMANRKVRIAYAADGAQVDTIAPCDWNPVVYNAARWHPSIHMPRWACRLVLPLVSVRSERTQDITEDDAKAEGVEPIGGSYREGFRSVWQSIYGTWDLNPWVWVAEWKEIILFGRGNG